MAYFAEFSWIFSFFLLKKWTENPQNTLERKSCYEGFFLLFRVRLGMPRTTFFSKKKWPVNPSSGGGQLNLQRPSAAAGKLLLFFL